MSDALVHRGPDGSGEWVDAEAGVAMGLRRLAILDLSPAGHQPMMSPSGRYIGTFNGEIYNFSDLRKELRVEWRGHSDTEVMLAAFDAWRYATPPTQAAGPREVRELLRFEHRRPPASMPSDSGGGGGGGGGSGY